ncbi:hypothetical protein DFH09DRAFT_1371529 [Mycena vulgaris]|nr:hypothetical protein DFH09DRAFT_1371529 [Mycena vulgaris]
MLDFAFPRATFRFALRHAIAAPPTFKFWISRSREVGFTRLALDALSAPCMLILDLGFPRALSPGHRRAVRWYFYYGSGAPVVFAPPPSGQQRAINMLDLQAPQATVYFALPPAAIQTTNRTTFQLNNPFSALPASNLCDNMGGRGCALAYPMVDLQHSLGASPSPETHSSPRGLCARLVVQPAHSRDRSTLRSQLKVRNLDLLHPHLYKPSHPTKQRPRRDVCNNRGAKVCSRIRGAACTNLQPRSTGNVAPVAGESGSFHAARVPRLEPEYVTFSPTHNRALDPHAAHADTPAHSRSWRMCGEPSRIARGLHERARRRHDGSGRFPWLESHSRRVHATAASITRVPSASRPERCARGGVLPGVDGAGGGGVLWGCDRGGGGSFREAMGGYATRGTRRGWRAGE